jgi:hypothetical protein
MVRLTRRFGGAMSTVMVPTDYPATRRHYLRARTLLLKLTEPSFSLTRAQ